jgi:hypothetical protein
MVLACGVEVTEVSNNKQHTLPVQKVYVHTLRKRDDSVNQIFVDKIEREGVFGVEEEGGGVRSGPGAARTILLFHIISASPFKQPRMVRTFLKVYMELVSYFLFLQEHKKDIIIINVGVGVQTRLPGS